MNCASISKVFFYILNVIFGFMGLCVLGYALYGVAAGNAYPTLHNVIGIILGIVMILGFALGCFGIHRISVGFMSFNVGIVGVILILQLIALVQLYSREIERPLTILAENAWSQHKNGSPGMATLERQFECCGLHGYNDYSTINQSVPSSCYSFVGVKHDIGCLEQMRNLAHVGVRMLKIVSWIIFILEGALLAFGIIMANHYRQIRKVPKSYDQRF